MSIRQLLGPVYADPVPCKICDRPCKLYGVTDFNRCVDFDRLPLCGIPIYYRRCTLCGFLFTDAFDGWSIDQFKAHIYNAEYGVVDPDYQSVRPEHNAEVVANTWKDHKSGMRVLDFGGGNGALAASLRRQGFIDAMTYDPIIEDSKPCGKFDLITCFETFEHLPDPVASVGEIVDFVADPGAVFFTTLMQPDDLSMSWWYIGPRNGHISLFSREALKLIWARYGFSTISLDETTHMAFRRLPEAWQQKD